MPTQARVIAHLAQPLEHDTLYRTPVTPRVLTGMECGMTDIDVFFLAVLAICGDLKKMPQNIENTFKKLFSVSDT